MGARTRSETVARLHDTAYDLLVIGGGVTGAGIALDAASRGLRVALVEKRDWAAGTSSRSGKLIHGGLRYLEQLNFGLVAEALRERGLILQRLAPHLAQPLQFLYPFKHRFWERPYSGAGLILYDTMGGAGAVPRHRHISLGKVRELAPDIDDTKIAGAATFYDVQIDDARFTVELVRTAVAEGADAAAAVKVTGLLREGSRVTGAQVVDLETREAFDIHAHHVVSAAGVWTAEIQAMSGAASSFEVTASKGVHILIPRDRIDSSVSMFIRAEDSVLIVRTWGSNWLVGTTDTKWTEGLDHPAVTQADIDYLLRNLNSFLKSDLTVADIRGVYAGLRPLVAGRPGVTSKLSREHAIETPVAGFTEIAGGKLTTYRVMAEDVVDHIAPDFARPVPPSRTEEIPLLGARGFEDGQVRMLAALGELGLDDEHAHHLLGRYGMLADELVALMRRRPELKEPIPGAPEYLAAEIAYAVSNEDALHLDDVLTRRTHIASESEDRGLVASTAVAELVAAEAGWDAERTASELAHYRARVAAEVEAQRMPDDASAMQVRDRVRDIRLQVADTAAPGQDA